MKRFLLITVCLLAGLSDCQAGSEGNQAQITELIHENLSDTLVDEAPIQNLNQGLEIQTISTASPLNCEPPNYTVLKELGALQERLAATLRTMEDTNKRLEASEKKLSELTSTVAALSTSGQEYPVAFSASLGIDGTIGPANFIHSLVYRNVLSNIGGHYSPDTGYFRAPVKGVYYFTFTSFCWGNDGTCGGSLYQNGRRLVSWYGHSQNHPTSGSNSAILLLQAGHNVNVRLWENRRMSDNVNKYSTFSGFLLFPM